MRQVGYVTAFLVISLFAGLVSELSQKTVLYDIWTQWFVGRQLIVFTGFFLLLIGATNVLVWIAAQLSRQGASETTHENFARYGLTLLPLVLTGYMAYHLYYFINLGVFFPIILWQAFEFEIFRQLVITVPPLWVLRIQQLFIIVGLTGTLVIMYRLARARQSTVIKAIHEALPHALVALFFGFTLIKTMQEFFFSR